MRIPIVIQSLSSLDQIFSSTFNLLRSLLGSIFSHLSEYKLVVWKIVKKRYCYTLLCKIVDHDNIRSLIYIIYHLGNLSSEILFSTICQLHYKTIVYQTFNVEKQWQYSVVNYNIKDEWVNSPNYWSENHCA